MSRPIRIIAAEIHRNWPKPYFGAVPYLNAMRMMEDKNDRFGMDDAKSIVNYFLCNASSFRGEAARRLKTELKDAIK